MSVVGNNNVIINVGMDSDKNVLRVDALEIKNGYHFQAVYCSEEIIKMGFLSNNIQDIKLFLDMVLFKPEDGMTYNINYNKQEIDDEKKDDDIAMVITINFKKIYINKSWKLVLKRINTIMITNNNNNNNNNLSNVNQMIYDFLCLLSQNININWNNAKLLDLKNGTGGKDGETQYIAPNNVKVISSNKVHAKTNQTWHIGQAFNGEINTNPCFLSEGSTGTLTFEFPKEMKLSHINVYPTCKSRAGYVTDYNIEVFRNNGWNKLFDLIDTKNIKVGEKREHIVQQIVSKIRFNLVKKGSFICLQEIDFFVVD